MQARGGIGGRAGTGSGRAAVPGRPFDDMQGVLARVTQRPQLAGGRDDGIQRGDRQAGPDPPGGSGHPGRDVSAAGIDLLGDQREIALGVGVAEY